MELGKNERNRHQKIMIANEVQREGKEEERFRKMNRRDRKRQEIEKMNNMDIQQLEQMYKNLAINHQPNDLPNQYERKPHKHHHHHKQHFEREEAQEHRQRGWGRGRGRGSHHHHRQSNENPFRQLYNKELEQNEESDNQDKYKSNSISQNSKGQFRNKKRKYDGDKRLPRQQWEKSRRQIKDNNEKYPKREQRHNRRQKFERQDQAPRHEGERQQRKWEKRMQHQMEGEERQEIHEKERQNRAEKIQKSRKERQVQGQQRRQARQNRNKGDKFQNRGNRNNQDPNQNAIQKNNFQQQPVKAIQIIRQEKQIPEYLICPITQELMSAPMILATCGHTFQETIIRQWLEKQEKCPLCNKPSQKQHLIKNFALAEVCRAHK